jgi:hypothetical protein
MPNKRPTQKQVPVPTERVLDCILQIRKRRVILDADLAQLYGVTTKRLNEQIRRNRTRFPQDFLFQLTKNEKDELVANCDRFNRLKHSTALPWAFTEHGAIMVASVLNTPKAVETSVLVVRAFVRLRHLLTSHQELTEQLRLLEKRIDGHDQKLLSIVNAIQRLLPLYNPPAKKKIGFTPDTRKKESTTC